MLYKKNNRAQSSIILKKKIMKINILLPVFNDWESLNFLLKDFEKIKNEKKLNLSIEITIIDDCSTLDPKINEKLSQFHIKIIKLNKNVGSQKAINIGLRYLEENKVDLDYCIIMDSDGEDKAEDLIKLVDSAKENKGKIIFSSRGKREDGFIFYLLYKIYLFFFYIFTGKNINFGNFSCIPKKMINEVINLNNSEIHHSASILKSNLLFKKIKCNRGKRFIGESKMSFKNLALHGLNGMAIFFELILVRFFIFSILVTIISVIIIAASIILKINNFIEILNWITNTPIGFTILFIIFLLIGFLIFLKLLNKNINNSSKIKIKLNDIITIEEK